ncbi:MAG: hypothetical protein F6K24_03100 [Okeania sp. SIO2D1]|nr:hypothetical protein [Okeania sp. SIO2D1]
MLTKLQQFKHFFLRKNIPTRMIKEYGDLRYLSTWKEAYADREYIQLKRWLRLKELHFPDNAINYLNSIADAPISKPSSCPGQESLSSS